MTDKWNHQAVMESKGWTKVAPAAWRRPVGDDGRLAIDSLVGLTDQQKLDLICCPTVSDEYYRAALADAKRSIRGTTKRGRRELRTSGIRRWLARL